MGAVYGTLLTEGVLFGMYVWYLREEAREMFAWQSFIGPGLGAIAILTSSLLLNAINVWLVSGISFLLYGLIVVMIDRSSLRLFRQLVVNRQL